MTRTRNLLLVLLGALTVLCLLILWPFLSAIVWAVILAYVSWPAFRVLRRPLHRHHSASAALMTLLTVAVVILPVLWLLLLVQRELAEAYRLLNDWFAQDLHALPMALRRIPWLGGELQAAVDRYASDPQARQQVAVHLLQQWSGELANLFGTLGREMLELVFTIMTLFFLYRDGGDIVNQAARVVRRFFAERLDGYIAMAGAMTRAVLLGFIVTSIAQGAVAGIGYWMLGVGAPVILGVLTGALSVIPVVGTAVVWLPLGLWMMLSGPVWKGLLLIGWGALVVNPTDNLIKPLLISSVTQVPFMLILFGAVGGLAAFGLVGGFVGPVLLAVAVAVWREWAGPPV